MQFLLLSKHTLGNGSLHCHCHRRRMEKNWPNRLWQGKCWVLCGSLARKLGCLVVWGNSTSQHLFMESPGVAAQWRKSSGILQPKSVR